MGTPPGGELLKKIEELEENIAHLKQEMSKLKLSGLRETRAEQNYRRQRSHSISPQRSRFRASSWKEGSSSFKHSSPLQRESRSSEPQNGGEGDVNSETSAVNFTDKLFRNILQSMGQSVHVLDLNFRIIYWNHSAENLYGFSAEEALGQDGIELIVDPRDFALVNNIVNCVKMGESWTGQFPARNKMGEKLLAVATNTPFYDDDGNLSGTICVSNDSQHFLEIRVPLSGATHFEPDLASSYPRSSAPSKFGIDTQQPLQVALASKFSNLALKMNDEVKSKVRVVENNVDREDGSRGSHHSEHSFSDSIISDQREDANSSGASTPLGDVPPFSFGEFYKVEEKSHGISLRDFGSDNEAKPIHNIITSNAEPRNQKKSLSWPFKANQQEGSEARNIHVVWPWQQNDLENRSFNSKIPSSVLKPKSQGANGNQPVNNEAPRSWSSSNVNNLNSASSHGSAIINNKVIVDTDYLDYEILWEDLMIGEQIGKGSCGTVYRAMWYGSDIALKVFSKQDYSDDVVLSFRQEVSLMKRLRHPNVLLFMGVVTSPQLCIVTEFLPRGSLFCLLQRNTSKFNWRRRVHMAIDIARGVNYLHHCNPPIIHYDLKSANLLVDKNWTVKVGDFDLSRLKHEAYITTKTGKGTPQWMAPEVLRNEPSDEKSDIYSFGVIMWEIATEKIPWDTLNSIQVIGAVGFMNQRLEIPNDVDPRWADMIESCWHSDPACRPTSRELLERLREMQKLSAIQLHTARSAGQSSTQNQKDSLIPS